MGPPGAGGRRDVDTDAHAGPLDRQTANRGARAKRAANVTASRRVLAFALAVGLFAAPVAAAAQPAQVPVIGFLRNTPSAPFTHLVTAFRQELSEAGFVEGRNVTVEYRWADNQLDRLPGLAGELVRRPVAVIVGNSVAAQAAKDATRTIPIVFVTGDDPVKVGFVRSLSRPGGNLTGVTFFGGGQPDGKRVELLHELVPKAARGPDPQRGEARRHARPAARQVRARRQPQDREGARTDDPVFGAGARRRGHRVSGAPRPARTARLSGRR